MAKPRGFGGGFGPGFGVGRYRYALTPWEWVASGGPGPRWQLPASCVGGVDLRPLPAQAAAGGAPVGFAFAASLQPVGGVEVATALHMADADATALMRDAWQGATGYRPAGAKVVDLLWDQLTAGADPSGESGPKPLVPGVDNVLRLHVGGHSLVKSERFAWGAHPHTERLRDLLRRDFEALWEATNGAPICRKALGYQLRKYRLRDGDWRELVPARLHAHLPGPLRPETTITESFPGTSDTFGGDLAWAEVSGDWDNESGRGRKTNDNSTVQFARAEHDLSGDDHTAQVVVFGGASGGTFSGPATRFASGAATCYTNGSFSPDFYLLKYVGGTQTVLTSTARAFVSGQTMKQESDGSTQTAYANGASLLSATDTGITGNTRCGLMGYGNFMISGTEFDDFEAADLGGAPAGDISGTCSLSFGSGSSALTGAGALSGSAALVFDDGASALSGAGALAGAAALTFDDGASALSGAGGLAGASALAFAGSATPEAPSGELSGSAALAFGHGATTLTGAGQLAGSAALTLTPAGAPAGAGALAGSATLTFTLTATEGEAEDPGAPVCLTGADESQVALTGADESEVALSYSLVC